MDETCGTLVYQAPEQMAGGQCYGKTVDVWAAGFIMYELIAGKHPLWEKGDNNEAYKEKALNFTKLRYGRRFNKLSQGLLEKLCHPKPSLRYTVDQALQHPWITRNFEDEIPRNHFEQSMYLNDIDDKLRKIINLVFTLSVIKN
jgi:serine/threonine protein kinase